MPLYEFTCTKCHDVFEEIESANAEAHPPCPRCGGASERMVCAPHLKTNPFPLKGTKYDPAKYGGPKTLSPLARPKTGGCAGGGGGFS